MNSDYSSEKASVKIEEEKEANFDEDDVDEFFGLNQILCDKILLNVPQSNDI